MKNFTQIPNSLISDPYLTDAEFRTYAALLSFKYGDGKVFPSQQTIATMRHKSKRSIQDHLLSLLLHGLISYKKRGFSKSNLYIFLDPNNEENFTNDNDNDDKNLVSVTQKTSSHIRNNLHTNNTKSKNTFSNNTESGITPLYDQEPEGIFIDGEALIKKMKEGRGNV